MLKSNITCTLILKRKLFFLGRGVGGIKVEHSLSEEQFKDANEEQLLAPFAFVAVNSQVTVSNIFVLKNDLNPRCTFKRLLAL